MFCELKFSVTTKIFCNNKNFWLKCTKQNYNFIQTKLLISKLIV